MPIPTWMLHRPGPEPAGAAFPLAGVASQPRSMSPLRRAVGGLARLLETMLVNEHIARQPGMLQAVDARAKVIGMLGLIVVVTLVRTPSTLVLAYAASLLLAGLSRVPLRNLLRVWLAVPLFSAAIVLPAAFNVVTPGAPLVTLWHLSAKHFGPWALPPALTVTDAGLYVFGRFVLRTAVCVTLALLLTATTRSSRLFRGLRALGVPVLFVMLLSMMERYLSVFLRAAEEVHLAKISRSIARTSLRQEQAWVAAGMGALFRRTQSLGNAVYLAMISRGHTGEIHLLETPRWQLTDWAFLMLAGGFGAILLILG